MFFQLRAPEANGIYFHGLFSLVAPNIYDNITRSATVFQVVDRVVDKRQRTRDEKETASRFASLEGEAQVAKIEDAQESKVERAVFKAQMERLADLPRHRWS